MSARLKGRRREVEQLISAVGVWVGSRADVLALGVVGSYAYRRPRLGSDVDLVLLTSQPELYGPWIGADSPLAPAQLIRHQRWGPMCEWRFRRRSGLHVEFGVATPGWADVSPLDPGTARVISDGCRSCTTLTPCSRGRSLRSRPDSPDVRLGQRSPAAQPVPVARPLAGRRAVAASRGHISWLAAAAATLLLEFALDAELGPVVVDLSGQ